MDTSSLRSAAVFAQNLIRDLRADPSLVEAIKNSPDIIESGVDRAVGETDSAKSNVIDAANVAVDMSIYKIVVRALSGTILLAMLAIGIISVITLLHNEKEVTQIVIPDGLVALASAAVGALAGLLTPLSRK